MEKILVFFWSAVVFYGVSTLLYFFSHSRKKEYLIRRGLVFTGLGFIFHTTCIALYWSDPSRLAFSTFQIINDASWAGVFVFLLSVLFARFLMPAGILVMPVTVFLQVWAALSKTEISMTPPEYITPWFWTHVIASALAYGCVLLAGALGLIYILKSKREGDVYYDKLPTLGKLDTANYIFVGFGFVMLTLMIIVGSLWTKQVQGSYWGWDPLEVQSLITWIGYAIWLHLRLTFGWRGKKLAWYSLLALPLMVIAIWGIPLMPEMFHRGFRVEHI